MVDNKENLNYTCWRAREIELKKDDVPVWKTAGLRRDNMNQLCSEWMGKELDYDLFGELFDRELKEYDKVTSGRDYQKSIHDSVSKIAPNFAQNLEKFKSGITSEKLLKMDCVKSALEHCKILGEAEKRELNEYGNTVIFSKKTPPPEPPKKADFARNFGPKDSGFGAQKQNQFSIYQTIPKDSASTSGFQKEKKKSFFEETLKKKRKFNTHSSDQDSDGEEMEVEPERKFHFKSAKQQYEIDKRKNKNRSPQGSYSTSNTVKKSLGARPRNVCFGKFVPPSLKDQKDQNAMSRKSGAGAINDDMEEDLDPRLKSIEPKIIELVTNEIMDHGPPVQWDDIAGLEFAKSTIKEIVIWPMLRPDIFTGLRGPPKGILLFGPPGTGKTLIGKCIASQSGATFFSISASSLTSKWVGEGEKMVRALFAVAGCHQPAVIFIDEIDSLLSQRSDSEHESSRRIKTEFLVQLDGAATSSEERILVVGATNRPQEIDEAARRRLSKRLYIPLPEADARKQIVQSLLEQQNYQLSDQEISKMISETDGYSGADMANLCREAALGPIRSLQGMDISAISKDDVRPIILEDFHKALVRVRPSVSSKDLDLFVEWNKQFGCCAL